MESDTLNRYIQTRYAPDLMWYERRALWNRTRHRWVAGALLLLSALTPVLALTQWTWVTVAAASSVAVLTGLARLFRFEQLWVSYRSTAEAMKRERWLMETGSGPYASASEPAVLFVERLESLIAGENQFWSGVRRPRDQA